MKMKKETIKKKKIFTACAYNCESIDIVGDGIDIINDKTIVFKGNQSNIVAVFSKEYSVRFRRYKE